MTNTVKFAFAAAAATSETQTASTPGEIVGVWVEHTSGTGDIDLTLEAYGTSTPIYNENTPADGAFNPVRRMQTVAGADNTGAGEFQHFHIPDGGYLKVALSDAWTGNIIVAIKE